ENAKSQAQVAKAQAEVVKAHAGVAQSALDTHSAHLHAVSDVAAQEASQAVSPPQRQAQPQNQTPPVSIQFNAEHALSGIGQTMQGMAQQHMDSTSQQMQVFSQLLNVTVQTNQAIAALIQEQRQENLQNAQTLAASLEMQRQANSEQL